MSKALATAGERGVVLTHALVGFRDDLAKAKKKDEERYGLDTDQHEQFDGIALAMLTELGWTPPKKKGKEPKADQAQLDWTKDQPTRRAKVQCLACARNFAVPAGEHLVACPDCGTIHLVKSDGQTVYKRLPVETMPDHLLALLNRKNNPELKQLSPKEAAKLAEWMLAHPHHTSAPELVKKGERVADPAVPGSGNALRIDCSLKTLAGTECAGFDSTDTPGTSVCSNCGQKYVVSIEDGRALIRLWSQADEDVQG